MPTARRLLPALIASLAWQLPAVSGLSSADWPTSTSAVANAQSWSNWESLGGKLGLRPDAVSWGPGRLDVFVVGPDSTMWDDVYDGSVSASWHWNSRGPETTTVELGPATSFSLPGSIELAARSTFGSLEVAMYSSGSWQGFAHCIQGQLASEPSAISLNGGTAVYVEGTDHQLWKWSNAFPDACGRWQDLGGVLAGAPAAVYFQNANDYVFVRGTDLRLWYWTTVDNQWHDAGGALASKPDAALGGGSADAFAQGTDGALWHYGMTTHSWDKVGGRIIGPPSAVVSGPNSALPLDVFVEGTDHRVWHASSADGTTWQWEDLGGYITAPPSAVSWGAGRFDVFAKGGDNALWHRFFQ